MSNESFVEDLVRDFFLLSGAMDNEFDLNDFNTEYVDSTIDEQCFISVSVNN
ncbi:hypothetical protein [Marivirga sp.]|uniref:hypothetical protein n=1 Tax=Marivirga sp. TaxID=2018662 RepID=UPI003DA75BAE